MVFKFKEIIIFFSSQFHSLNYSYFINSKLAYFLSSISKLLPSLGIFASVFICFQFIFIHSVFKIKENSTFQQMILSQIKILYSLFFIKLVLLFLVFSFHFQTLEEFYHYLFLNFMFISFTCISREIINYYCNHDRKNFI